MNQEVKQEKKPASRILAREVAEVMCMDEVAQVSGGKLPVGTCTINVELDSEGSRL
jgi:hypothetical protein